MTGKGIIYVVGDPGVMERFVVEPLAQELFPIKATLRAHLLKLETLEPEGKVIMRAKPAVEKFPELLT